MALKAREPRCKGLDEIVKQVLGHCDRRVAGLAGGQDAVELLSFACRKDAAVAEEFEWRSSGLKY
jgi:hypothetical protein